MAKFRCKLSGNVFEFTADYDIEDMREHPQYEEVEEEEIVEEKKPVKKATKKDK